VEDGHWAGRWFAEPYERRRAGGYMDMFERYRQASGTVAMIGGQESIAGNSAMWRAGPVAAVRGPAA